MRRDGACYARDSVIVCEDVARRNNEVEAL